MIKIGIPACFMYPNHKREVFAQKTLLYMGHDMSLFLGHKGVMPVLIPYLQEEDLLLKILNQLDGFLFQGGTDINPELYGEDPLNSTCDGDPQRDLFETTIMKFAIENKKPILGVCRGMQLINVFFGGELYQDIPTFLPKAINHFHPELYDELTHEIILEGSLNDIFGKQDSNLVNSVHHQAVKKLGDDLKVEAFCPQDNIIEGIVHKKLPITGIQWHPEFFHTMDKKTLEAGPALEHFLKQCSE